MNKKRKSRKAFQLWEYYFYKKQDDEKAIYNFKRAIWYSDLYWDRSIPYRMIAKSYMYLEKFMQAMSYIDQALERSPHSIDNLEVKRDIYERIWDEKNHKKYWQQVDDMQKQAWNIDLDSYLKI